MLGVLAHQRLGMECNTQSGCTQHWQVIGAISNGDGLLHRQAFSRRNLLQGLCFPTSSNDFPDGLSGNNAVADYEFVGIDKVKSQFLLKPCSETAEATGDDGRLVAQQL